jgi:hypothetical protein
MEKWMQVIIHTHARATAAVQHTLRGLNADGVVPTLVVQYGMFSAYKDMLTSSGLRAEVYALPDSIKRLAPTRDHIIHDMAGDDHVVFMDDDLHFAVRRDDDRTRFRQPEKGDIRKMLMAINIALEKYPMVGVGAREGGNRVTEEYLFNTRIMRVLAFRRSYLKKHSITFTPLEVMEDFHVNLQVLRSGADTCICNDWVSNQAGGSDAPGGCSTYRTDAVQDASARLLAARHPGFVRVVQKTTKTAWGGKTRTDVVVSWKQARKSAEGLK